MVWDFQTKRKRIVLDVQKKKGAWKLSVVTRKCKSGLQTDVKVGTISKEASKTLDI